MKFYYVTGNLNKLKEAKEILSDVEGLKVELTEIQSLDSREVIKHKLEEARKLFPHKNLIVDDASVYFACLGNLPGPFIKWFLKTLGLDGIVELVKLYKNNKAYVVGMIGVCFDDKIEFFEGRVDGKIVGPRGDRTFGWDPIFEPEGYGKTYAEMGEEKNKISHRRLALEKLKKYMESFKNKD